MSAENVHFFGGIFLGGIPPTYFFLVKLEFFTW
jgi:hypothetical protein